MQFHTTSMSTAFVSNDDVVHLVVRRVNKFIEVLSGKEMDLNSTRKEKRKIDSDDNWEPSQHHQEKKFAIDFEIEVGGRIIHPHPSQCTRSTHFLFLMIVIEPLSFYINI